MRRHRFVELALRYPGKQLGQVLLRIRPDNVAALILVGVANAMRGDLASAEPALLRAAELDGRSVSVRLWLSRIAKTSGRLAEASQWARLASEISPGDPLVQTQLQECEAAAGDFATLSLYCERAANAAPKPSVVWHGLGIAFWGLGRTADAVSMLERAIELEPTYLPAINELSEVYRALDDRPNALRLARRSADICSGLAVAQISLATALIDNGEKLEGEEHLRRAIGMGPHNGSDLLGLGFTCQSLGHMEEAAVYYRSSIERMPKQGGAYYWLTQSTKMTERDRPLIDQMANLLSDPDVTKRDRENLCYALGKAMDDLAQYRDAMERFEEGNRFSYELKFGGERFQKEKHEQYFEDEMKLFTRRLLDRHRGAAECSPVPIFIVGMIRSGTTLMEQILSAHPKVGAAGEQQFWPRHHFDARGEGGLDAERLRTLAEEYCNILNRFGEGKPFVTDKMPGNFCRVGLLSVAFPNARFIHMRRHPVANCLSIYTTYNAARVPWGHNKDNIAFYYRLYLKMMDHWRSVMEEGRLLEVSYEHLVSDTEGVVMDVCRFCDLEWDPICLRPENNLRPVRTPSVWQVSRPVYDSSLERWKHYEEWLGPFKDLLLSN